ncbi:MAG: tetratricopeptide repeat protein [Planctomycetia bacterium]|nr:tetratricopeptide repeat protein [Planctomycetia bacterium]
MNFAHYSSIANRGQLGFRHGTRALNCTRSARRRLLRAIPFALVLFGAASTPLLHAATVANPPAPQQSTAKPANGPNAVQPADDELAPLLPRQTRTEHEDDRLTALSHYAAARIQERSGRNSAALANYARAYRYDPQNVEALRRCVALARELNRHMVAARYASELVMRTPAEPLDLLRAVIFLRQEGRTADALSAYEKSVTQQPGATPSPVWVELHKQAGELYLQAGRYSAAAAALAHVDAAMKKPDAFGLDPETLKLVQGDSEALLATIAEAYLRAGRDSDAADVWERSAKLSDDPGLLLYGRAQIAFAARKYDDALAKLDRYLTDRRHGQGEGPYRLLADVLTKQQRSGELLGKLERARATDELNDPLAYYLASQYLAADKLDKAQQLYEKLLAAKPASEAYRGLVESLRKSGQNGPLLTTLGNAVTKTGMLSVLGAGSLAISGYKATLDAVAAEADKRLKAKPPTLAQGERLALALLAAEGKQFEMSNRFFELALATDKEQPDKSEQGAVFSAWGLALLTGDRFAEAARVFQRALDEKAISPDNPALYYYLAGALAMDGRFDGALVAARRAAVGPTPTPESLSRIGWVLYRAKRYDQARQAFAEVLRKFDRVYDVPGVREEVREARSTWASLNVQTGNSAEAIELLEQVLDEYPDNISARNDLGYLWADQGVHLNRALTMLREAVAAEPENLAYRDSLGWALFRLGRNEEALVELKRAAAEKNPDGVVLDHLGDVLHKLGRNAEALAAWRQSVAALDKAPLDKADKKEDSAKSKATQAKIDRVERSPGTMPPTAESQKPGARRQQ